MSKAQPISVEAISQIKDNYDVVHAKGVGQGDKKGPEKNPAASEEAKSIEAEKASRETRASSSGQSSYEEDEVIIIPDSPEQSRKNEARLLRQERKKKKAEELCQEKKDPKSVKESLFNQPRKSKQPEKKKDKVQDHMEISSRKNPVSAANILSNYKDTKYDKPTLENLKKYFKGQNFQAKTEKVAKKDLTNEFLQGIMANGEYWCLGKMLFIMKKCMSKEIAQIYLNSIEYKLSLEKRQLILKRVKFPARELSPNSIRFAVGGLAAGRQGYGIDEMIEFYRVLKDQHMLIRTVEDFKLLILPLFYLFHGEAYDSSDPSTMASYYAKVTKNQINIQCLKCNQNDWSLNFTFEFLYHNTDEENQPIDITVNTRGSACHQLHYLATHQYLGNTTQVAERNQVQQKEKKEKAPKPPKEAKAQKKASADDSESKKRGKATKVVAEKAVAEETKVTDEKDQNADSSTKPSESQQEKPDQEMTQEDKNEEKQLPKKRYYEETLTNTIAAPDEVENDSKKRQAK